MNFHNAAWSSLPRTLGLEPLTEDQLRKMAPSIFASAKHDSRSERYTYIPTIEIVRALQKEGFEPMLAKQGGSRVPGKAEFTKHMVRFRHRGAEARQVGDIRPEVALINSHDGTSSYRILAGAFRLLCLNGMVAPESLIDDVRVGHTGEIRDKVIEGTWSVIGQTHRVMETADQWRSIELTQPERLAFAEEVHRIRFEDATPTMREAIKPLDFIAPRRREDVGNSLWLTFNTAQENVMRGGLTGHARNPEGRRRGVSTRAIRNIDQDVELNRSLWRFTQRVAELKGGA